MSLVTGALASIGPKLLQLLHDEYKLQKGVKKQVQWLSKELEIVYAFLGNVADVPWDQLDEQVKVWVRQVRDASYDMEAVLDTYLLHVDSDKPTNPSRIKRAMMKMGKVFSKGKACHDIASAIEDMKKHLAEVAQRRQNYKLDDIMSKPPSTTSVIDPRLIAMYKEVTQLIGVDKSRDELISMLMPCGTDNAPDKMATKKVSIVGVGGLGKTTLAKAAYDKLKLHYDYGAFVSIGRELDLVRVFKDILFDLDRCKYENIHNTGRGADLLIHEIREFLKDKRYVVVVDDVWEVKTLERIKLALVENNFGSIVITTTRKSDVAKEAGEVYKLQPLSDDNSKKLFYTRISSTHEKCLDNQTDHVSDKILKKCGGIPLAIITMSSLLVGKPKSEWSKVYNSIGFGHDRDNKDVEDTMMILSFSYYDLPSHLRTCLLYLSTYREDSLIGKVSLIWKWIAEGFVHEKQGRGLFELGERYFNDLVNRSMIEAVENEEDGRVFCCRVHDMVLDMIRRFSVEENFIDALDDNVDGTSSPYNVRWLRHQNKTVGHINAEAKVMETRKVRSYIAFSCQINNPVWFLRFKLLRVLDFVYCRFKEGCTLEHLGTLLHLRYLRLSGSGVPKLPKQIGDLKLLQTLDVFGVEGDFRLPASIVLLPQLVCLCGGTCLPDGIGKLTSLEELIIGRIESIDFVGIQKPMKELGSLRQLRVLDFSTDGMDERVQKDFVESLRNLQNIQHIVVRGLLFSVDTALWEAAGFVLPPTLCYFSFFCIEFSKLPSCFNASRLPNLTYLTLCVITMDEQDLRLLARLPALCFLELGTMSTVTASNISARDGCFQKLRYFQINAMVQFEEVDGEDYPSVSLHIWKGKDAMPFGSGKNSRSKVVVPSAVVMPSLEGLNFVVPVWALKENNADCGNIGLEHLPSLQRVAGHISCVSAAEGEAALAALRNACELHPNHPALQMDVYAEAKAVEKQQHKEEEEAVTEDEEEVVHTP